MHRSNEAGESPLFFACFFTKLTFLTTKLTNSTKSLYTFFIAFNFVA